MDLLAETWDQLRHNYRLITKLSFWIALPFMVILFFMEILIDNVIFDTVLATLISIPVIWITHLSLRGRRALISDILNKLNTKLALSLWTLFLFNLGILLGLILFIIPGIIFAIYWVFSLYVVVLKNKSGLLAMYYSRGVVRGRWWRVLLFEILFWIVVLMIVLGIGLIFGIGFFLLTFFASLIDSSFELSETWLAADYTVTLVGYFGFIFGTVLMTVFNTIFFIDLDSTKKKIT